MFYDDLIATCHVVVSSQLLSEDVPNGSVESSNSINAGNFHSLYTSVHVRTLFELDIVVTAWYSGAGKQLVQFSATPVLMSEPISSEADLPSLLELEAGPFFISDSPTDDPADALLSPSKLDSDLWCHQQEERCGMRFISHHSNRTVGTLPPQLQ